MHIVYCHTNKKNGKKYIGFTPKISTEGSTPEHLLETRWRGHCQTAIRGSELAFHKAIRKYGVDGFEHAILEECASLGDVLIREIYWIAHLSSTIDENGYNMTCGGEGNLMTEATREKHKRATSEGTKRAFQRFDVKERHQKAMMIVNAQPSVKAKRCRSQKIAQNNPEVNQRRSSSLKNFHADPTYVDNRRICTQQFDLSTGQIIATYISARAAARQTGLTQGNISHCARGNTKHAGGFGWRYVSNKG